MFLNLWTEKDDFQQVPLENCNSGEEEDALISLKQKLKKTKTTLSRYSKECFHDIFK